MRSSVLLPTELLRDFPRWMEELAHGAGVWRADVRAAALRLAMLPLYVERDGFLALDRDANVHRVRWQESPQLEQNERARRRALAAGARRYPTLEGLLPERPVHASTCEPCNGSGIYPKHTTLACDCDGLGWTERSAG